MGVIGSHRAVCVDVLFDLDEPTGDADVAPHLPTSDGSEIVPGTPPRSVLGDVPDLVERSQEFRLEAF